MNPYEHAQQIYTQAVAGLVASRCGLDQAAPMMQEIAEMAIQAADIFSGTVEETAS